MKQDEKTLPTLITSVPSKLTLDQHHICTWKVHRTILAADADNTKQDQTVPRHAKPLAWPCTALLLPFPLPKLDGVDALCRDAAGERGRDPGRRPTPAESGPNKCKWNEPKWSRERHDATRLNEKNKQKKLGILDQIDERKEENEEESRYGLLCFCYVLKIGRLNQSKNEFGEDGEIYGRVHQQVLWRS